MIKVYKREREESMCLQSRCAIEIEDRISRCKNIGTFPVAYLEIVSLSALIAGNTINCPGRAALYL